eukprot:CAMPEP_0170147480 /NCGR_PEP_ID=MMETSP0033_2-20121228/34612_1 /TAXON_ID=195969 /ORGANISM="Dolichomastix tenuilepis, Strain CCMP3274" /LENGTH=282 /DNA_ID=CAMNT_0010384289 /DNA_START=18 /DNA_END=866 /DNA_ORIENTATION=-
MSEALPVLPRVVAPLVAALGLTNCGWCQTLITRSPAMFKALVGIAMVAGVVAMIVEREQMGELMGNFVDWVEREPVIGAFAFMGVYAASTVLFLPGIILTLGAGAAFGAAYGLLLGLVFGTLVVLVGATVGSVTSFLLGRYVLRDVVQRRVQRLSVLRAVNEALEHNPLRLMILLRLSPLIPFSAFNFAMGISPVTIQAFVLGCVGFVPGSIAYVYLGAIAGSSGGGGGDGGTTTRSINITVYVVGGAATLAAMVLVTRYARDALRRALDEAGAQQPQPQPP